MAPKVAPMSLFTAPLRLLGVLAMAFAIMVPHGFAATKQAKPKVTAQPASQAVEVGEAVEFSVGYVSASEATVQWRRNKQPIAGATNLIYAVDVALPEDAGSYDAVVTNAGGTATSKAAKLTVMLAPASLPVDTALNASITYRIAGETAPSEGVFIVTGANSLEDPENPSDTYTFTYTRLPKDKAKLVINGRFWDSEVGYITVSETLSLTFTGVSESGELEARVTSKGSMSPPAGYRPAKLGFSGTGTMTIATGESAVSSGALGGTLTIGGSNTYSGSAGAVKTGTGSLSINPGPNLNSGSVTSINGGVLNTGTVIDYSVLATSIAGISAVGSIGRIGITVTENSSVGMLTYAGSGAEVVGYPESDLMTGNDLGLIVMDAASINLANITFDGNGSAISLGTFTSGTANFGDQGTVNFISSVSYASLTFSDASPIHIGAITLDSVPTRPSISETTPLE